MTNKQELNEKELEQISGGSSVDDYKKEYPNKLDKYETANHIGEELFFVAYTSVDSSVICEWIIGTLLNSYEKESGCGTIRTATVSVNQSNVNSYRGSKDISLDKWTAYSK